MLHVQYAEELRGGKSLSYQATNIHKFLSSVLFRVVPLFRAGKIDNDVTKYLNR